MLPRQQVRISIYVLIHYNSLTVYIPCTDESARCFTIELVAIAMSNINGTPAPLLRRGEKIEEREEKEEKV